MPAALHNARSWRATSRPIDTPRPSLYSPCIRESAAGPSQASRPRHFVAWQIDDNSNFKKEPNRPIDEKTFWGNEDTVKIELSQSKGNYMNTNQETIKAAAKRMCNTFAAKGVQVKHTLMLEALADGLGVDGWRKLKDIIDAPRQGAKPSLPEVGTYQQWIVDAMYLDNSQPYGDRVVARTPLEAAFHAMVERLTDFGLQIGILRITDSNGQRPLTPNFMSEIVLTSNRVAITTVLDFVKALDANHAYDVKRVDAFLKAFPASDSLGCLTECDDEKHEEDMPGNTIAKDLGTLCDSIEEQFASLTAMEIEDEVLASAVYQVRAMVEYFRDQINSYE